MIMKNYVVDAGNSDPKYWLALQILNCLLRPYTVNKTRSNRLLGLLKVDKKIRRMIIVILYHLGFSRSQIAKLIQQSYSSVCWNIRNSDVEINIILQLILQE